MCVRHSAESVDATVVKNIRRNVSDEGWLVTLADKEGETAVRCHWLVDATGRRSIIACNHGSQRKNDDALVGIFATFFFSENAPAIDEDSRILIEAAPDGWCTRGFFLQKAKIVVYMTDAELMPREGFTGAIYLSLLNETRHCTVAFRNTGTSRCANGRRRPVCRSSPGLVC